MIMINQINMHANNIINCVQMEMGGTRDSVSGHISVVIFFTPIISDVAICVSFVIHFQIWVFNHAAIET